MGCQSLLGIGGAAADFVSEVVVAEGAQGEQIAVVAGMTSGIINLGVHTVGSTTTQGAQSLLIAAMDLGSGVWLWAQSSAGDGYQVPRGLAVANGLVVQAGWSSSSFTLGGATYGKPTGKGPTDLIVSAHELANGKTRWIKGLSSTCSAPGSDDGRDVVATETGFAVLGNICGDVGVAGLERTNVTDTSSDAAVLHFKATGELGWARRFGAANSQEVARRAFFEPQTKQLYVAGSFEQELAFEASMPSLRTGGLPQVFVAHLNATTGQAIAAGAWGGPLLSQPTDLVVGADGWIYLSGFSGGTAAKPLLQQGWVGAFAFGNNGELGERWSVRVESPNSLVSYQTVVNALALTPDRKLLAAGSFDPGAKLAGGLLSPSAAGVGGFLLALEPHTGAGGLPLIFEGPKNDTVLGLHPDPPLAVGSFAERLNALDKNANSVGGIDGFLCALRP